MDIQLSIIIGLDLNGLSVCRSLGQHGIRVDGISVSESSPGVKSKYLTNIEIIDSFDEDLVPVLVRKKDDSRPLLFPTTDRSVEILCDHYDSLVAEYKIGFRDPKLVKKLLDKYEFKKIAFDHEFKTTLSQSFYRGDDVSLDPEMTFPLIVKTHKKFYGDLPKAIIVDDELEAVSWINKYLDLSDNCLVEEYIGGPDSHVYFVFVYYDMHGNLVDTYCGRKIRQWPPLTGGTASAEPWQSPELEKRTIDFFDRVGFTGLGSMEYKYDDVRKEFFAIEPTVGRIDFQEGLAIKNGVNFPYYMYCDMFGIEIKKNKKITNKSWICFDADYNSISQTHGRKSLEFIKWLFLFFKPRTYSLFDMKDMKPFLVWFKGRFLRL